MYIFINASVEIYACLKQQTKVKHCKQIETLFESDIKIVRANLIAEVILIVTKELSSKKHVVDK